MANTTLHIAELRHLPHVCARCGAAATDARVEEFTWTPQWAQFAIFIGLLPLYILVKLTQERVTVPLPVCDQHRREKLTTAQWVVWGGIAAAAVVAGVGVYLSAGDLAVYAVGAMVLLGMVAVFVCNPSIRATHISNTTITLNGVSEAFAEAVEHGTRQMIPTGGMALQTAKYFRG